MGSFWNFVQFVNMETEIVAGEFPARWCQRSAFPTAWPDVRQKMRLSYFITSLRCSNFMFHFFDQIQAACNQSVLAVTCVHSGCLLLSWFITLMCQKCWQFDVKLRFQHSEQHPSFSKAENSVLKKYLYIDMSRSHTVSCKWHQIYRSARVPAESPKV